MTPSTKKSARRLTKKGLWAAVSTTCVFLAAATVVRDLYPRVVNRLERRTLGSIPAEEYYCHVERACLEQLLAGAHDSRRDETRFLFLDDVGDLWARRPSYFLLDEALLAKGIGVAYARSRNPTNLEVLTRWCDGVISGYALNTTQPSLATVDQTVVGEALIDLYLATGAVKYRIAADNLAVYLLKRAGDEPPSLLYRKHTTVRFVDTIGMICPFLTKYATTFDRPEARAVAIRQLREFNRYGFEQRTGLPFHGYNPAMDFSPVGLVGWGRGAGWYAMGLIDTIASLSEEDPDRKEMEEAARAFAQVVVRYQRPDGGWGSMLSMDSPFDSSATAMLGYFLQRAINLRVITDEYVRSVELSVVALRRVTRSNGRIDYAQGPCINLNRHSSQYGPFAYAQGPALALLAVRSPPP